MSQTESSSDSDSNTSSSWIFIDDCPSDNQRQENKYYLNCDSEPVQELTSQCLNSANLESETDSDGISIISESDDVKENGPHKAPEPPLIEDIKAVDEIVLPSESLKIVSVNPQEYYFNKYVIVGWVLIAVATPLLVNFFSIRIEEILGNYNDNAAFTVGHLQPEVSTDELYRGNKGAVQGSLDEFNPQKQVRDSLERKKRYDSKGEIDEHRLDCRDHFSIDSNFNRRTKERNNKHEELLFKETDKKKDRKADVYPKRKKKDSKIGVLPKTKNKHGDEFAKHRKNEKTKKEKEKGREYTKEIKKLQRKLEGRDKDIKGLIKLIRAKDKQLKMLEFRILKHLNALAKSEKDKKYIKLNSTDGEWYHKLHKGRSTIRKKQRDSDWADLRNKKRNLRNNWYWNWMENREQLRLKRGFWQFTY